MTAAEIGTVLTQVRKEQGMTREALSRKSGVSPQSIIRYEKGHVIPREHILQKLSRALPLPLEEMEKASHAYHETLKIIRRGDGTQHIKRGPRRKSLPSEQRVSAVAWAADRAGMSYGHFVARTPQDEDTYKEIYQAYQAYLKEGCSSCR